MTRHVPDALRDTVQRMARNRAGQPSIGRSEIFDRMETIAPHLLDWYPSEFALTWWRDYDEFGRYPFGYGTWGDQPEWVTLEINRFGLWIEWERLQIWLGMLLPS